MVQADNLRGGLGASPAGRPGSGRRPYHGDPQATQSGGAHIKGESSTFTAKTSKNSGVYQNFSFGVLAQTDSG